jgi:hypothetical protein
VSKQTLLGKPDRQRFVDDQLSSFAQAAAARLWTSLTRFNCTGHGIGQKASPKAVDGGPVHVEQLSGLQCLRLRKRPAPERSEHSGNLDFSVFAVVGLDHWDVDVSDEQSTLVQLVVKKGVLAEIADKSRVPRCENATRHGEANFWIRSRNQ